MMSSKGQFVVKLPMERVDELVASGQGEYFDLGHGRLMKEWVVITGTDTLDRSCEGSVSLLRAEGLDFSVVALLLITHGLALNTASNEGCRASPSKLRLA
jgi:hypothetical protein